MTWQDKQKARQLRRMRRRYEAKLLAAISLIRMQSFTSDITEQQEPTKH